MALRPEGHQGNFNGEMSLGEAVTENKEDVMRTEDTWRPAGWEEAATARQQRVFLTWEGCSPEGKTKGTTPGAGLHWENSIMGKLVKGEE